MKIKWHGHSCFEITTNKGTVILTDPFDEKVGYKVPKVNADIVTVSHDHYDHNNTSAIISRHELINNLGEHQVEDVKIIGVTSYHDEVHGAKRGNNIIFKYYIEDVIVVHLGDLGHPLTDQQIELLNDVDILLIPVGGIFTINDEQASALVNKLNAKVIIPMHFKTPVLKFELESVVSFIKNFDNVIKQNDSIIEITTELLNNSKKVIVLDYK